MNNLSFLTAGEEYATYGDRAADAGIVTLLGIVAVFLVLTILWGVIELLHVMLNRKKAPAPAPKAPEPESQAPATAEPVQGNGAVVAAIVAAITAARAEEGNTTGFRVVSFNRVSVNGRKNRF